MSITQDNRRLKLTTPLPYDELLIKRLRAVEAVSQLFRIELEIVKEMTDEKAPPSIMADDKLKKLVGQPMTVTVVQDEGGEQITRHFNGICASFVQGSRNIKFSNYRAELVPHVWLLTRKAQSRIFQQKSVPDILKKVFEGFDVKFELEGSYQPRNYCVQYRETDFNFASRLMEEEGIYYFFKHLESGHQLVLADTPKSHKDVTKPTIPFIGDRSGVDDNFQSSILTWRFDDRVHTGKYTLWDHTLELVGKTLEAQEMSRHDIGGNKKLEIYDWPGGYAHRFDGVPPDGGEQSGELQKIFEDNKRTVKIRQQELDVAYKTAYGTSDCCALVPGFKFKFDKHPYGVYNTDYIILSTKIEVGQHPWYMSSDEDEGGYEVSFIAMPLQFGPFRPLRQTPRPFVHGCQTAVVVGRSGEEIFTDKYGRVKVQFPWDREGRNNEASSCWIPVGQMWSGKKWGTMFIPRIGMEVIVNFIEGNPDRPIIVGCVNNAENMPAYTLPDEKTKTYIKSNSSTGGNGFNEIRFEDKKGEEQFFVHAERDHETRVKRDQKAIIIRDKHTIVNENHYEKVKRDKHLGVTGDQVEKVDGNVHLKVGSNKEQKIGLKYAVDSGNEIHLKAGMSVTIEAGVQVTLKAGGNFVNIGPSGVSIKGTMVLINSGGAAGSGGGASPGTPKDPLEADKADSGQVAKTPPPPPPPEPPQYAALASVVRQQTSSSPPPTSAAADAPDALRAVLMEVLPEAIPQHDAIVEAMSPATLNKIKQKIAALGPPQIPGSPLGEMPAAGALAAIANAPDPAIVLSEDLAANIQAYAEESAQRAQAARDAATAQMQGAAATYSDEIAQQADEVKQAAATYADEIEQKGEEAKQVAASYADEVAQQAAEAKQVAATYADEVAQQADEVKQAAATYSDEVSNAAAGVSEQASQALQSARSAVPFM